MAYSLKSLLFSWYVLWELSVVFLLLICGLKTDLFDFFFFKNLLRCVPECSDLYLTSNPGDYCIQLCPFWFYTTAPVWFWDR